MAERVYSVDNLNPQSKGKPESKADRLKRGSHDQIYGKASAPYEEQKVKSALAQTNEENNYRSRQGKGSKESDNKLSRKSKSRNEQQIQSKGSNESGKTDGSIESVTKNFVNYRRKPIHARLTFRVLSEEEV
jgi:type IV secretory pathway VirB10-like protein